MKVYLFFLSFLIASVIIGQKPDIILTNGKVFTANVNQPYAESVAITGNIFSAIGKTDSVQKLAGANTKVIDLKGKTVIPGINDAHYHHVAPYSGSRTIVYPMGGSEPKWNDLADSIQRLAVELPDHQIIFGVFGTDIATDTSITRKVLDKLSPDNPVILSAFWGHITILNTAAIKLLGLKMDVPDPRGGYFSRMPGTDIINGRVYEMAQFFINDEKLVSNDSFLESLKELGRQAISLGITSIQNMCTGGSPIYYNEMLDLAKFPVRFRMIRWATQNNNGRLNVPDVALNSEDLSSLKYTVSGTKWLLEGTPLEQLAEFREGYKTPNGWKGKGNYSKEVISKFLDDALNRNDQPHFHIAGDKILEELFTVMESRNNINWPEKRVRIEHGDGLLPDLFDRAGKLGVIVVQNPTHFSLVPLLHQRYKGKMEEDAFQMSSLINSGIKVALGSDGPINPFLNIMLACIHPYNPKEALTVEQAVTAYTLTAAFAEFEENRKGSIEVGKLADLAVLSQDIFTVPLNQLPGTVSVMTIVNGREVTNY